MKKLLIAIIMTCISLASFGQGKTEKLQELIDTWAGMNKFNGSILVTQQGKTLLHQGYGYRNVSDKLNNETGTVFQIGSITKQFTATVILKLQEQGKLNVEDKVNEYLPSFPKGDSISIENLLTHTSGIFNYTDDVSFMETQALQPIAEEKMIALFKDKPLGFTPGTDWAYSNSNYMLLGYIIQKVSKKPYEQVVRELIFDPLQMTSTGFDYKGLKSPNKAKGYFMISGDISKESPLMDSTVSYAAGGMYSTTDDLYKWHRGLLSDKVLQKASLDKAFTPFKNKYGYGISIDSISGKKVITHGGMTFGFTSNMVWIPTDDVCIVILNNVGNPGISEITKDILAIIYERPYQLPEVQKEIKVSAADLQKYAGTYELALQFSIVFTVEDGQLIGQATGQPKMPLYAAKEDSFFLKVIDAQIEFKKDAEGNLNEMVLIQAGMRQPGKKIK